MFQMVRRKRRLEAVCQEAVRGGVHEVAHALCLKLHKCAFPDGLGRRGSEGLLAHVGLSPQGPLLHGKGLRPLRPRAGSYKFCQHDGDIGRGELCDRHRLFFGAHLAPRGGRHYHAPSCQSRLWRIGPEDETVAPRGADPLLDVQLDESGVPLRLLRHPGPCYSLDGSYM